MSDLKGIDVNGLRFKNHTGAGFANQKLRVDHFRKGFMLKDGDQFDEPTYLTFVLDFDFGGAMTDNTTSLVASPLFNMDDNVELKQSAYQYFFNRGNMMTAKYVQQFNELLKYITYNTPWYFQSISGLDKIWSSVVTGQKDGFNEGLELEISCLESIDLRLLHLAELYQKITYDQQFMRANLPENLRNFWMRIHIGEVRELYNNGHLAAPRKEDMFVGVGKNILGKPGGSSTSEKDLNGLFNVNSLYYYTFDCFQCEFDFSGVFASKLQAYTDKDPNQASFKIKINRVESAGSFGSESFTSNLYRDKYSSQEKIDAARASLVDDITNASSQALHRENLTLMKLANSLGPFSQVAKSELLKVDRKVQGVMRAPNRFVNSVSSELQRLAERGSLGKLFNSKKRNF